MPIVNFTKSLQAGVQKALADTWKVEAPKFRDEWQALVRFLPPVNIRSADYAFKESIPFPNYWGYNQHRQYDTLRDRQITVHLFPYQLSIPWNRFDAEDDQIGDLLEHIQSGIRGYMELPYNFVSEYLNASADILPSVNNAYDGVALYSTVDGDGNDRFEVSNGNIYSGSGVTTEAAFMADLVAVQRRFLQFRAPNGRPIFTEKDVSYDKLVVVAPPAMNGLLLQVSKQEFILGSGINNNAESNYLKGTFRYQINPFLTDSNDWFVFVEHPRMKAFAYRGANADKDIFSIIANSENSDYARDTGQNTWHSDMRAGIAPYFPASSCKVSN